MKAAVLVQQNKPLKIMDLEIPELGVGQVLVKVAFSGICGKQIDEIMGKRPDPFLPHLLGHEGSGIVEEVGAGVKKVKKGDHIVLHWMKGSGIESDPPRFGKISAGWVTTFNDYTIASDPPRFGRISAGWVTTFNDYTIASENRVTKIPEEVGLDVASLLGCAVTTGLGIVFNNADLKPGQSIIVFGCGGIGLNVIQGASLVNAYPIVAVDIKAPKLEMAEKFGANQTIKMVGSHRIENFDVAVDTTGIASVREMAYNSAKKVIFAGVPYADDRITIDSYPIHMGRQIIGSHGGATNPDVDIPRYLKLYELGKLKLDEQITHRFPLEEINEAIEVVRKGEAGRCLIWI